MTHPTSSLLPEVSLLRAVAAYHSKEGGGVEKGFQQREKKYLLTNQKIEIPFGVVPRWPCRRPLHGFFTSAEWSRAVDEYGGQELYKDE